MINKIKFGLLALVLSLALVGAGDVNAQALTWTADQTVDLSDPDISFTIVSGSEATSLVVGTGSIQVVVPNGDIFTITSTDRDFSFSGDTSAIVSSSCTDGTSTGIVTGGVDGETITINLTGNVCNAGGGGGGGGGGGSSKKKATPATPAVPASEAKPADCTAGIKFSPSTGRNCNAATPATPATPASALKPGTSLGNAYAFGQTLIKQGVRGEACKAWQMFLNAKRNAALVADGICGPKTMAAARAWQAAVGLKADGILGPMSRAKAMTQ